MIENEGVQKIIRPSIDDCRNELFRLYGYDYTVIRSYEVKKKGLFGSFSRPQMCVLYRVKPRSNQVNSTPVYDNTPNSDYLRRLAESQAVDEEEERLKKNREQILAQHSSTIVNANIAQMDEVKAALEKVREMQETMNRKLNSSTSLDKPETISRIEELLSDNEFSMNYINMITEKIRRTFSLEQLEDFELIEKAVVDWIGESIEVEPSHVVRPPHVKIIVGPTGVGKTTTLVKMVAKEVISAKKSGKVFDARLITTDFTRVGALEQLKHFAEILGRDVDKAETMDDLKILYENYRLHCDGIYIDTGGYSPNDSVQIGKLKDLISVPGLTPEIYLAFDAKTKCSDLKNIMNNYEPFAYNSVIVTKCDESKVYGNIISSLYEKHKTIAYVTDGQNAARNIEKADPIYFLEKLIGFNLDMNHLKEKFSNSGE
ncbi:MAG: hypothetical protein MJ182_06095 [Treponema sp.]|nr:hypothetical protein [Treponema sp.]